MLIVFELFSINFENLLDANFNNPSNNYFVFCDHIKKVLNSGKIEFFGLFKPKVLKMFFLKTSKTFQQH